MKLHISVYKKYAVVNDSNSRISIYFLHRCKKKTFHVPFGCINFLSVVYHVNIIIVQRHDAGVYHITLLCLLCCFCCSN